MSRAVRYAGTWRLVDGEVSLLREGSGDIAAESNSLYLAGCNWKQNNGPTTGSLLLVVVEKVICARMHTTSGAFVRHRPYG